MSVSSSDLLSQAKALLAQASSEVEWRNCIGRAYYAAFHAAKAFHQTLNTPGRLPAKPVGIHAELAHQLTNPTISNTDPRFRASIDVGQHLKALHRMRVRADYDLDSTVNADEASDAVARAGRLCGRANWRRP